MTQEQALEIMLSGSNVFITGDAGTGKTYTTTTFINTLRQNKKNVVVVAPTGVAALNIGGATIHSTFKMMGMYPMRRTPKLQGVVWRDIDCIVIDEISMVGPDILDQIDYTLKCNVPTNYTKPFGGIQVVIVGDPGQLKPVYAPNTMNDKRDHTSLLGKYGELTFDKSEAYRFGGFKKVHLSEVKRQTDAKFMRGIQLIKEGFTEVIDSFNQGTGNDQTIHLMATNAMVHDYNHKKYEQINLPEKIYYGHIEGDFNIKNVITPDILRLKPGCRVMVTKNLGSGLVNGDTGIVHSMYNDMVDFYSDRLKTVISIERADWLQIEYRGTTEAIIGRFSQIPLKLSWAMTIHKSQGLTLDNVCVHVTRGMQRDLLYVGVSRAVSMDKLFINRC